MCQVVPTQFSLERVLGSKVLEEKNLLQNQIFLGTGRILTNLFFTFQNTYILVILYHNLNIIF